MSGDVYLLALFTLLIFLSLVTVFTYLLTRKHLEKKYEEKIDEIQKEISPTVYSFVIRGEEFGFDKLSRFQLEALERTLKDYSDQVEDSDTLKRVQVLAEKYFTEKYTENLLSNKWSTRMNTLYRLADFRMKNMSNVIIDYQQDKITEEERFQVMWYLTMLEDHRWISQLQKQANYLSDFQIRKLFSSATPDQIRGLLHHYTLYPISVLVNLIDVIGVQQKVEHFGFLEQLLSHDNKEVRLRVLKAFGQVGYIRSLDLLTPFITSPEWQERLMVLKVIQRISLTKVSTILESFLHDSSWWVRNEAAKILSKTSEGKELLRRVIENDQDQFAADIAREWIEKGK